MTTLPLPLALGAGELSVISPCVLPVVPVNLGYLSGNDLAGHSPGERSGVLRHAGLFVGGFSLVFVIVFGLPATVLGEAMQDYSDWIERIGGALVILFGLHVLGVVRLRFLSATYRLSLGERMTPGYARSVLVGATFAAGWTPCIGPLLGTVLTLALTEPSQAIAYVIAYAAGLALPFLLVAGFVARTTGWIKRLNRGARAVELISGGLMVVVGLLLVTGMFGELNGYLNRMAPEWLLINL